MKLEMGPDVVLIDWMESEGCRKMNGEGMVENLSGDREKPRLNGRRGLLDSVR